MTNWANQDGLIQRFGGDSVEAVNGNEYSEGPVQVLEVVLDYADLPVAADANQMQAYIPANAYITQAFLLVDDAFESGGTTTLDIGLCTVAGAVIDLDGIDAVIAKTAIDGDNDVVVCDGALVRGVLNVGTANAYVYTTVGTGPYTAGHAKLVVHYITNSL
jgi:hypothetical protein